MPFDFAQQIHILLAAQQVGPIYFLVPNKVDTFGVVNDTTKRQCNFSIFFNGEIFTIEKNFQIFNKIKQKKFFFFLIRKNCQV